MIPNLFNTLRQRFSRNRIALPLNSAPKEGLPKARNEIVLSRGWCLFRRFDFESVPARRRPAALAMEIQRWSPFENTAHCAVWQGGQALVWGWDASRVAEHFPDHAAVSAWWPESLLRAAPAEDGAVLRETMDGLIGQVWRDHKLLGEYWWPQAPSTIAWQRFCRANGVEAEFPEQPESLSFEAAPFASQSAVQFDGRMAEKWTVVAGLVLFAGFSAYHLGASARLLWENTQLQNQEQLLIAEAEPVLAARARAVNAGVESSRLLKHLDAPSVQALLEKTAERMPSAAKLRDWRFNLDRLEFSLEGAGLSALDVVQAYQSVEQFADVQAAPGARPEQLLVSVRVK